MSDSKVVKRVKNARLALHRAVAEGRDQQHLDARQDDLDEAVAEQQLGKVTRR